MIAEPAAHLLNTAAIGPGGFEASRHYPSGVERRFRPGRIELPGVNLFGEVPKAIGFLRRGMAVAPFRNCNTLPLRIHSKVTTLDPIIAVSNIEPELLTRERQNEIRDFQVAS